MGLTLAEALKTREDLKQRLAVWEELLGFLSDFVSVDFQEAVKAISPDDCVADVVSQEALTEVVKGIQDEKVTPLRQSLMELDSLRVHEEETPNEPDKKTPKGKKQKGPRAVDGKQTGGPKPKVASVPKRSPGPRPKAQIAR